MTSLLGTTLYRELLRKAQSVAKAAELVLPTAEIRKRLLERVCYWESFSFGNRHFQRPIEDVDKEAAYRHAKHLEIDPAKHPLLLCKHAFRSMEPESLNQNRCNTRITCSCLISSARLLLSAHNSPSLPPSLLCI